MHISSTATATIKRPLAEAWAVLADHEGMSAWGPGIKVTLSTEGSPDRNGVGAVRRISTPGPTPTIVEEITAFEPTRYLAYRALSGVPLRDYRGEVELTDQDGQTFVQYTVHADSRLPLVEKAMVKGIAKGLLSSFVKAAEKA